MKKEINFILPGQTLQDCSGCQFDSSCYQLLDGRLVALVAGYPKVVQRKEKRLVELIDSGYGYYPKIGDLVIGMIKGSTSDSYIVDISAPYDFLLGYLEFQGATKKTRPVIHPGSLVFATVVDTTKWMRGRLTCKSSSGKQWMTGESEFGELKGGTIVRMSRHWRVLVERLGRLQGIKFAKGQNNFVWIKSSEKVMIWFQQLLQRCSRLCQEEVDALLNDFKQIL